jgi:hypothetical protein
MQNTTTWFKRVGFLGFVFFLAKGLLWLTVLGAVWRLR